MTLECQRCEALAFWEVLVKQLLTLIIKMNTF